MTVQSRNSSTIDTNANVVLTEMKVPKGGPKAYVS